MAYELDKSQFTQDRGCIIRGPRDRKRIALEFTGGYFADGGQVILDELAARAVKGSFFFIGDFFRNPEFHDLIAAIRDGGHYLGPHSDAHPLYASWEEPPKLLVTEKEFRDDLDKNMQTLERLGIGRTDARYFIPPFEHFTPEISQWTRDAGMVLINYTPGTRSHTDYMEDDDQRYVTSEQIVASILDYEKKDPDGLAGFLLLMHIGSGPRRTRCHLYRHLGGLLDELISRRYSFARVDELLTPMTVV
jgi:peptidoglycan/xylan/chitin deacetylase (PgdA/CDA1 family)